MLLLLKQKRVGNQRETTNVLAVRRIWEWKSFVAGEIVGVVFPLPTILDAGDLCCCSRRAVIRPLEQRRQLGSSRVDAHGAHSFTKCLRGMSRHCHWYDRLGRDSIQHEVAMVCSSSIDESLTLPYWLR